MTDSNIDGESDYALAVVFSQDSAFAAYMFGSVGVGIGGGG